MGNLFAHAIFICLCYSCVKTREITLPNEEDKLVINCLFNTDSIWRVNVSATKSVTNTTLKFVQISNAHIQLYENEIAIGTFTSIGKGNYLLNTKPQFGKKYKITVTALGYDMAYAEDSIIQQAGSINYAAVNTQDIIQETST